MSLLPWGRVTDTSLHRAGTCQGPEGGEAHGVSSPLPGVAHGGSGCLPVTPSLHQELGRGQVGWGLLPGSARWADVLL